MIRIPIELDRYGLGKEKSILATLVITNDGSSSNPDIGDYKVYMLGKHGRVIRKGEVKQHRRRSLPVGTLVRKALEAMNY